MKIKHLKRICENHNDDNRNLVEEENNIEDADRDYKASLYPTIKKEITG